MDDSTFFIVGANGQLGKALQAKYPRAKAVDSDQLDITSQTSVQGFDWSNIKVILNAAAYTNVDGAESAEGRIAAWKVNAQAVGYLAQAARQHNLTLVHISTDYVFDGRLNEHQEDEPLSPLSVYGASKAAGDLLVGQTPQHYILRTSWVIGDGQNFVRTMLGLGQKGVAPTVVHDQVGRLTFTSQLVSAIDHLLSKRAPAGTYNVSNSGPAASWADITRQIFKDAGYDLTVSNTTTVDYYAGKDGIAPRPLNSQLNLDKIQASGLTLRDWQQDLQVYVKEELAQ
jgi:dTDP-4-dehydrorhamnose 3,5-epimerase